MRPASMNRNVQIFLSKNGAFRYASKGTKKQLQLIQQGFLPCASVNTPAEAEQLQTALCKLERKPNASEFFFPISSQDLEGLEEAGRRIEMFYQERKAGRAGWGVLA